MRHGIEQVGDKACATLDGSGRQTCGSDTVTDRKDNAATDEFFDGCHDSINFRSGGDDAHANRLIMRLSAHQPVFGDGEIIGTVHFLEGFDLFLRRKEELGLVCATLGELDEGALCVPAEKCRRRWRAPGMQEVEKLGVQRTLLCLQPRHNWSVTLPYANHAAELTGKPY